MASGAGEQADARFVAERVMTFCAIRHRLLQKMPTLVFSEIVLLSTRPVLSSWTPMPPLLVICMSWMIAKARALIPFDGNRVMVPFMTVRPSAFGALMPVFAVCDRRS